MTDLTSRNGPASHPELDMRLQRVLLNACTAMGKALTLPKTHPGRTPDLLNEVFKAARRAELHARRVAIHSPTAAEIQIRQEKALGDLGDMIDTINFRRWRTAATAGSVAPQRR